MSTLYIIHLGTVSNRIQLGRPLGERLPRIVKIFTELRRNIGPSLYT
jgi:hypothetical protein